MLYESYLQTIDKNTDEICGIADTIWENPELGYQEHKAVKLLTDKLKEHGFSIQVGLAGMPTAFRATYGDSAPHMGILAEYDALSGMSQEGCIAEKKSIPGLDQAHGCGHNLFAAGSYAAALAVKSYIEETGHGSITLFGCPAEEGGAGKVFMAREGIFNHIDSIVSWHPESMYMVRTRPALANVEVKYSFEGIASHAGANPAAGRSALDAVELMNMGCQFLREHMPLSARVHYAILDAGGTAPNMVQSHAEVLYLIRGVNNKIVAELYDRVNDIAKGGRPMGRGPRRGTPRGE